MSVIEQVLKFVGKDGFQLDQSISLPYLFRLVRKYGLMMLRGRARSLLHSNISNSVFIGKNVHLLEKRKLSVGAKTRIHDNVYIDALSNDGVIIGSNVVLGRNTRIECTGSLENVGKGVTIGFNSTFGNDCFFGAAGGITIGENVLGGQYIRFHSENHCFEDKSRPIREQGVTHQGIVIGDDCWLGSGAVILDGVTLGRGCVVGANAVVTKCFPDYSVIGGSPAKLLRTR